MFLFFLKKQKEMLEALKYRGGSFTLLIKLEKVNYLDTIFILLHDNTIARFDLRKTATVYGVLRAK